MRRLVGECAANRFVTGERLEAVLKVRDLSPVHPLCLTMFHRKRRISLRSVQQNTWIVH